jgi:adenylate kinase family enzyme
MNILADRNQVHKFIELNISDLIHTEVLRKTEAGLIVQQNVDSGKNIWADCSLIVKLLRRVIYSGVEGRDKFLLNGFPDQIE